jgi:hypothetical protein
MFDLDSLFLAIAVSPILFMREWEFLTRDKSRCKFHLSAVADTLAITIVHAWVCPRTNGIIAFLNVSHDIYTFVLGFVADEAK